MDAVDDQQPQAHPIGIAQLPIPPRRRVDLGRNLHIRTRMTYSEHQRLSENLNAQSKRIVNEIQCCSRSTPPSLGHRRRHADVISSTSATFRLHERQCLSRSSSCSFLSTDVIVPCDVPEGVSGQCTATLGVSESDFAVCSTAEPCGSQTGSTGRQEPAELHVHLCTSPDL
jgi:hypothetical protein